MLPGRDRDLQTYSKLVMLTSRSKKGNFFKDIIHVGQVSEMVSLGYCPGQILHQLFLPDCTAAHFGIAVYRMCCPGYIIGKGGEEVDKLKKELQKTPIALSISTSLISIL